MKTGLLLMILLVPIAAFSHGEGEHNPQFDPDARKRRVDRPIEMRVKSIHRKIRNKKGTVHHISLDFKITGKSMPHLRKVAPDIKDRMTKRVNEKELADFVDAKRFDRWIKSETKLIEKKYRGSITAFSLTRFTVKTGKPPEES